MKPMHVAALHPENGETHRDGFIVVAVLWILGALSVLTSVYATLVIDTVPGFVVHEHRLRTEALVSAALELTADRQLMAEAQSRPRTDQFNFRLDSANVAVNLRSETSRIDLNAAPKQMLAGLFVALGARPNDAELYGDRIIAWRTPPQAGQAEPGVYRAGSTATPRQANFPHTSELLLVPDLPPLLAERALPFLTVYSGRPQVNVFDAPPEVIAALPGMTPDRVSALLAYRQASPDNMQVLQPLLGAAQLFTTAIGSRAVRVNVRIAFDNGHRSEAEAVILLFEEGSEPYSVLSWNDVAARSPVEAPRVAR
jgi:general secretion pathway protein K